MCTCLVVASLQASGNETQGTRSMNSNRVYFGILLPSFSGCLDPFTACHLTGLGRSKSAADLATDSNSSLDAFIGNLRRWVWGGREKRTLSIRSKPNCHGNSKPNLGPSPRVLSSQTDGVYVMKITDVHDSGWDRTGSVAAPLKPSPGVWRLPKQQNLLAGHL